MPWAPSPMLPSIMPTFHLEQEGSKPLSSPYTQERAWYKGPPSPEPFLAACRGGLDSEAAGGGRRGGFRSGEVTSLKSKEESLQRAQMVASSTSPSYCPVRTGLSFFKLAAGWGGRKGKRQVEKIGNEMQREHRECSKEMATNLEIRWERE